MKAAEDRKFDDLSVNIADEPRFGNRYCLPQTLIGSDAVKKDLDVPFLNAP
jgi:hypothetical protein